MRGCAYTTSITLGLLIVFSLHGSSTKSTSRHKISPVEDIVVGPLFVASGGFCPHDWDASYARSSRWR